MQTAATAKKPGNTAFSGHFRAGRTYRGRIKDDHKIEEETGSEQISFEAQIIRTNGYHDGVKYPVVKLINSDEELMRYYDENKNLYDFSHKEKVYVDTTIGFVDAIEQYDAAWFTDHQLIIVLLEEGSGSVRHAVAGVDVEEKAVTIYRLEPEVGTADMAEWHILIGIDRVFEHETEIAVELVTPIGRRFIND